ncbi:MAG: hypothetical protein AAGF44_02925 [Pseudomonadota bacterium]
MPRACHPHIVPAPLSTRVPAFAIAAILVLTVIPAHAEEPADPSLREQLGSILEGLTDEVRPALDDIIDRLGILEEIDDFEHYARPKVLPNGDILIPRREDAPPYTPPSEPDVEREAETDPAEEPGIRL